MAKLSDYVSLARHAVGQLFDRRVAVLPQVGEQAPDFEVRAHDGSTVRLADYRGKKVLLWFYPKADTPG